jgi:hypothetical protein
MGEARSTQSWTKPILWGVAVGVFQAFSPLAFWWAKPVVVWSLSLAIIAAVYIGFAVADGRSVVIATEIGVASAFIVLATAAIKWPWLVVIGLVAHGVKDAWQHRTQFVVNTRWWPPFCLVVDFVAAGLIAIRLLSPLEGEL